MTREVSAAENDNYVKRIIVTKLWKEWKVSELLADLPQTLTTLRSKSREKYEETF